jgi:hypothetical protein
LSATSLSDPAHHRARHSAPSLERSSSNLKRSHDRRIRSGTPTKIAGAGVAAVATVLIILAATGVFSGSTALGKGELMSTTLTTRPQLRGIHAIVALLARRRHITRRGLQVALGVLWLLDGALQAQPFMFTRGFADQVIAPAGQGQPGVVSGPVHLVSTVIGAHPVAFNLLAVGIQLLLGVGLLVRRIARIALVASIGWALGVWYLAEGLSGLASGQASLLTGAPGSALLYAIIAAAAWPSGTSDQAPARWLVWAWALLWVGGAGLQLLPGQNSGPALASLLTAGA